MRFDVSIDVLFQVQPFAKVWSGSIDGFKQGNQNVSPEDRSLEVVGKSQMIYSSPSIVLGFPVLHFSQFCALE
jgi:hypothetical protein